MTSASAIHTTTDVCEFLDISRETLSRLAGDGIIPKEGRGRWNLQAVTQAYLKHLREVAAGRKGEGTDDAPALDLAQERAALARSQRIARDMLNDQLAGRLIDRDAVEKAAFEFGRTERAALEQWPARVAPALATEFRIDHGALATALEREVRAFLTERADAAPAFTTIPEPAPDDDADA